MCEAAQGTQDSKMHQKLFPPLRNSRCGVAESRRVHKWLHSPSQAVAQPRTAVRGTWLQEQLAEDTLVVARWEEGGGLGEKVKGLQSTSW